MELRDLLSVMDRSANAYISVYDNAEDAKNHCDNAMVFSTNPEFKAEAVRKHLNAKVVEFEPCVYARAIRIFCFD